jgi:hypothetical protein
MKIGDHARRMSSWQMAFFGVLLVIAGFIGLVAVRARNQQVQPPMLTKDSPDADQIGDRKTVDVSQAATAHRTDAPDVVDVSSQDSFPASDPPGWIRQRA